MSLFCAIPVTMLFIGNVWFLRLLKRNKGNYNFGFVLNAKKQK